ncbi:MAG: Ig-like domain-containing protein [Bacteroidia bacterium]|nr:Ig-like domain-containing protein [Bacteroidia bacterium]
MKKNLMSWLFCAFTIVLSISISKSYGQNHPNTCDHCIEYMGKTLFVGDTALAKKYLNDIIGTWEDRNGTKLKIYIIENPTYSPNPSPFPESKRNLESGELIIAADVEMNIIAYWPYDYRLLQPNYTGGYEIIPIVATGSNLDNLKGIQVIRQFASKSGFVMDKIKVVNADWCYFSPAYPSHQLSNIYEGVMSTSDIYFNLFKKSESVRVWTTVVNDIGLHIGFRKGVSWKTAFDFNSYLGGNKFFEYPTPLKRIFKGVNIDDKKQEITIKATSLPKEVKPDGQSIVEITATLYSSAPGDNQAAKPVSGKTVSFSITENYGITPGSLSAKSANTDANGQAKVVYTAPIAESLRNSGHFINSTSVLVSCPELKKEDQAYIGFISERGKVEVEPSMGISSSQGIVPPDKRFPALITATLQDENLQPLKFSKTTFSIVGANPLGMLRGPNGKEGKKIEVFTDQSGSVEVAYFYASDSPPSKPMTEIVEVMAENMVTPLKAEISIGLNIIFDLVENGYEGKGIINAGEEVPIRVKIKDAWNPELRLNEIINYWGLGGTSGDTPLAIRLEIKNLSSAPDYLLDYFKLEKYPEAPFAEIMQIRSFKDKGELNHLRMPEYALKNKGGYAKIRPMAPGNHYYEAKVTLTDRLGKEVFASTHPARKAYFNIKNGLPADATQIYFLTNPLNTETRESKIFATALDLMGIGALLSVTDAMYKINSGDSEGLFGMLFSEIKGVIFDKIKSGSAYNELAIDLYTGISLAEKVDFEIMKDKTGPIAGMEKAIFEKLYNTFTWESGQLVILRGDGSQKLFEDTGPSANQNKDLSIGKGNFKISISGFGKKPTDVINKISQTNSSANLEIPAKELSFTRDEKRKTTSLKKGNVSIFVIPRDMKVRHENASEIKIY